MGSVGTMKKLLVGLILGFFLCIFAQEIINLFNCYEIILTTDSGKQVNKEVFQLPDLSINMHMCVLGGDTVHSTMCKIVRPIFSAVTGLHRDYWDEWNK